MKLKYEFEKMELDDEIIAVPIGNDAINLHAVLKINETASDILDLLKKETSEEHVVDALLKLYSVDRSDLSYYVHLFIKELDKLGLIV